MKLEFSTTPRSDAMLITPCLTIKGITFYKVEKEPQEDKPLEHTNLFGEELSK